MGLEEAAFVTVSHEGVGHRTWSLGERFVSLDAWRDLAPWIRKGLSLEDGYLVLRRYDLFFHLVLSVTNLVGSMNNNCIQKKRKMVVSYNTCTLIGGVLGFNVQDWLSILADFYGRSVAACFSATLSRNGSSIENKMVFFRRRRFVVDGRIVCSHSCFTLHILKEALVTEFCYRPESPLLAAFGRPVGAVFYVLWIAHTGALAVADMFTVLASFHSNLGGVVGYHVSPTLAAFRNGPVIFSLIVDGVLRNHMVVILWCLMKEKGAAVMQHLSDLLCFVECIIKSHSQATTEDIAIPSLRCILCLSWIALGRRGTAGFSDLFDEFGHMRKIAYPRRLMNVSIIDVDMYVECWHPTLEIREDLDSMFVVGSIWDPTLSLEKAWIEQ